MENYRKKLKNQNILFAVCIAVLLAVQALAYLEIIHPAVAIERWSGFWNGFIAGAAMGVTIIMVIGVVKNLRAMRSEAALKRLYAKENDERTAEICRKAQSGGVRIFMCAMVVAIVVSGYFNVVVSLTCIACTLALGLTVAFGKLYWSRKL